MASISLAGKVAIVTSSSKGISRATALAFSAASASVVVNFNSDAASASGVVQQLGDDKADAVKADAKSVAGAAELVQVVVKRFGRIDVLVANAGRAADEGPGQHDRSRL